MAWNRLKEKCSIGFMIGIVFAVLHLCLVILAYTAYINSMSSTSALVFICFFTLDAPIHMLPSTVFQMFGTLSPLILYGVFGSAVWFLIPWLFDKGIKGLFPKTNKLVRAIVLIALVPLVLFGFSKLSRVNIKRRIQAQRPDELKKVLNQTSSDFLTESVVFEDDFLATIINVYRMDILENSGNEIIVTMNDKILFLDESCQEIRRLNLNELRFNRIEPLCLDAKGTYGFLGYRYGKGIWLLNSEANELWRQTETGSETTLRPDGAHSGDMNGDGLPEFALYYRYRDGIHLLDIDGNMQWKHPVYALGHLEMADLNTDGNAEIIYTNANNANGKTTFTILDATGTIVDQMDIATRSSEFEIISWPEENGTPCVLLTEENVIRMIDMNGQTIKSFDAPGCRTFGDVQAAMVTFDAKAPGYLMVKKNLHPDLMALYVFSKDGTLVYQKTDVMEMGRSLDFAVVPVGKSGDEGVVAGSIRDMKPVLIEYSRTVSR